MALDTLYYEPVGTFVRSSRLSDPDPDYEFQKNLDPERFLTTSSNVAKKCKTKKIGIFSFSN